MKDKQEIAKLISEGRKRKKLTQQDLAILLKVSDKAVSNWETGKNYPDYAYLNDLSNLLEIDFSNNEKEMNKTPKKQLKLLFFSVIILFSLLFLITGTYFITNFNQIKIYTINTDNKYYEILNSNLIISNNEIILNINEIINYQKLTQSEYKITLYYKENNKEVPIITTISSINLNENKKDSKIVNNLENLYIKIENMETNEIKKVKLVFNKIISNDKIIYLTPKENNKKMSQSTKNLLKNNNYIQNSEYKYEKINENEQFIYDYNKGIIDYISTIDDTTIKARGIYWDSSISNSDFIYEVYKNGELIEYYPNSQDNMIDIIYYWDIYNIIDTEYQKITP